MDSNLFLSSIFINNFDDTCRARKYGWPNTYVFTKAMAEMLLNDDKGDVPLVIVRPTIVTSTFKEPFPGWVEGVRYTLNIVYKLGCMCNILMYRYLEFT